MTERDGLTPEQVLKENGIFHSSSSGISMYPMLRHRRDMIEVIPVTGPLKKYDVPLYRRSSGKLILHRIIKITRDGKYIIRGDNLDFKELDVTDDMIIGVLKGFYRNGKYYNCETSRKYKFYIFWMRVFFPVRVVFHKIKPKLAKFIRRFIKKRKKNEKK